MPLPFRTSTRTLERGRSGCDGGGATLCTCTAGFGSAATALACDGFGARCTAPIPISATSSAAAIAPTTSVAVRHGKDVESCSACCIARIDSRPRVLLLPDPRPRLREPVCERRLRQPAELALGERHVEHASLELAEPRVDVARLPLDAARPLNRVVQLEHRRLDA